VIDGRKLRKLRQQKGLTVNELSRLAGLSSYWGKTENAIGFIETGKRRKYPKSLFVRLCRVLECELSDLEERNNEV
jgi:transcriptional regulator with XRE-family HTH domain